MKIFTATFDTDAEAMSAVAELKSVLPADHVSYSLSFTHGQAHVRVETDREFDSAAFNFELTSETESPVAESEAPAKAEVVAVEETHEIIPDNEE